MSSWKHLREEGRHFAKKHRVGAKRALVGVLIAAMTISTMNVPAIAEELGITADAQEQIIQDSTVNTENQSATAEGTPAEGTDATVDEGDDPADTSADAATDTTADVRPADDQQPDEAAGTESDQNNLTGGGSSENDPAAVEEDTTAQVAVKVANASLKYTDANGAEQTVSENKDAVDFPTQTEIKFSVTANDGFQASRVFYTVDGADTDVAADESGTYTIPAEVVNDGLAITVETAEIPAADEPAADDAAKPIDEPSVQNSTDAAAALGSRKLAGDGTQGSPFQITVGDSVSEGLWETGHWNDSFSLLGDASAYLTVNGSGMVTGIAPTTGDDAVAIRHSWGYIIELGSETKYFKVISDFDCTVTYHANNGTEETDSEQVYTKTFNLAANKFTYDGYRFAGWSTNSEATEAEYASGEEVTLEDGTESVDYYAVWIKRAPSISVDPYESLLIVGSTLQLSANVYPAESEVTWSSSDQDIASVDSSGLVTAHGSGSVEITATANGVSATAKVTVKRQSEVDKETAYFYAVLPNSDPASTEAKDFFYIGKGQIDATGLSTSESNFNIDSHILTAPDSDELKAKIAEQYGVSSDEVDISYSYYKIQWSPGANSNVVDEPVVPSNIYCWHVDMNVTIETPLQASYQFHLQDAGESGFAVVEQGVVEKGSTVTGPEDSYPTEKKVDGVTYRFDGWYTNQSCSGDKVSWPYTVDEMTHFYAKYVPVATYTVTYKGNGSTGGTVPVDNERYEAGDSVSVKNGEPTRTGHTFVGWSLDPSGEGELYKAGGTFEMPASNVTLYAVWEADEVVVTIKGNTAEKVYNGSEQSVEGYDYSAATKPAEGEGEAVAKGEFTVSLKQGAQAKASGTDAGTYQMGLTEDSFEVTSKNYSKITVVVEDGQLVITPVEDEVVVTIKGNTGLFEYDGTEKSVSGYTLEIPDGTTLTPSDIVCSDDAVVTRTNAGEDPMGLSAEDFACESRNYSNVVFEVTDGWIRIIAQSIDPDDQPDPDDPNKPTYNGVWISDAPSSVIYDGHSHKWAPTVLDKENGDALAYGEDYSVAYTDEAGNEVTDFTNVTGKIIVTITGEGNYTGSVTREYQITPRPVDLIIPEQTKTYDGTADVLGSEPIVLGFAPAAQMDEGFVAGDDLTVTIAPENVKFSQADVHTDGALIADIANVVADGEDAGNYMLRNISGIGSISEHGVEGFTLTASGYAGAYDGQEHAAVSSISVTGQYQPDTEWDLTFALSKDGEYSSEVPVVTNVSDSTTVWVKASNANYGEMTVSVEAQVTPLTLTVTANNQTKVAGTADPALTSTYTGALPGETPGWTGTIARVPGEAAGTYQIFQNTLGIEDNGAFLAGNYTLVFVNGTLTITAAPGGGDNPDDGGDDTPTTPTTPTTPGTTTDGGTPTVIEDAPEQPEPEQIDDDENPLAGPSESIDDDGTPLARPTHQDCWVHWLMILGIIVTAIYDVLVLIRRRKFTGTLASFEDEVLNDRNRNA